MPSPDSRKIIFLSNHAWGTANKAGFHLLAESYAALGHQVTFVTTGLSYFSVLRHDARLRTGRPRNRLVREGERLDSYLHFTPLHPHTLVVGLLNRLTAPLVRRYTAYSLGEAEVRIREADVVFFESCSAVALVKRARELNPSAKLVYRASDVITCMRSIHPEMVNVEQEVLPLFDLVSVPTPTMVSRFERARRVTVHFHGVQKNLFDSATESPYRDPARRNCVFVGMGYLDEAFLRAAAHDFPEVRFHIIGPVADRVAAPNVRYYGRLPFAETVPYIKYADVGLFVCRTSDQEVLRSYGHSLKMRQYAYAGLPIVLPSGIPTEERGNLFRYDYDDETSVRSALSGALSVSRDSVNSKHVDDWHDVAKKILEDLCNSST